MTPDLVQEFQSLSEIAKQRLKDVPESGSYQQLLSIWTRPSFSPSFRWTVYSPWRNAKGKQPFASYTIWRSDLDLEKLKSPVERVKYPKDLVPTIQDEVVWIPDDFIAKLQSRLCGIAIPFYLGSPKSVGVDGTSFEFQYDQLFYGGSVHWWENHPHEWQPFTNAIKAIAGDLDNLRKQNQQSANK
jgi:hypothetical protein